MCLKANEVLCHSFQTALQNNYSFIIKVIKVLFSPYLIWAYLSYAIGAYR